MQSFAVIKQLVQFLFSRDDTFIFKYSYVTTLNKTEAALQYYFDFKIIGYAYPPDYKFDTLPYETTLFPYNRLSARTEPVPGLGGIDPKHPRSYRTSGEKFEKETIKGEDYTSNFEKVLFWAFSVYELDLE